MNCQLEAQEFESKGGEGRGTGGRWMNDGCDDGDKEKDEQPRGN